jgi:hypothetical protein
MNKKMWILHTEWSDGLSGQEKRILAEATGLAKRGHFRRNLFNFIHYLPDMYITCRENIRDNLVKQSGFPANKVVNIPLGVHVSFVEIKRNPEAKTGYGICSIK